MTSKRTKLKAGAKKAAALAAVAGKRVAKRLGEAGDAALLKVSEGARKRKRTRALKGVGKALLVAGAAAATMLAGRAEVKRRSKSR